MRALFLRVRRLLHPWAIDPRGVLPAGPTWIEADAGNWRAVVDTLLRRCLFVVLVLVPGKDATVNLEWEVNRVCALGLSDRLIVVLPPPGYPGRDAALEALARLGEIIPMLTTSTLEAFLIVPLFDSVKWWHFVPTNPNTAIRHLTWAVETPAAREALAAAMVSVLGRVSSSFESAHPYWRTRKLRLFGSSDMEN